MAYIQKKTNKRGETVFKIKVSCGYDSNGKQKTHTKSYKPDPKMTGRQIKKEVERQAVLFEERYKNNELAERNVKFSEIAEEWLEFEENKGTIKVGTLQVYKGLRKRVYAALGNKRLDKIKRRDIQNFIFDLANGKDGGRKLKDKTQKNYIGFISNVFNYAVYTEAIKESPCRNIQVKKTEKTAREAYTLEEEIALLNLLEEKAPIMYRVLILLLMHLGLRIGEALGIEWKDIDMSGKTLFIERNSQYRNSRTGIYTDDPKTEKSIRCLILPDEILSLLPELRAEQERIKKGVGDNWVETDRLFIAWNGKPLCPRRPYSWLKSFCKRENLAFKGLHSFRHALVTNLIHNNVDVATVSSIVGHANPNVTLGIYTHEIRKATAMGCRVMSNLLSSEVQNSAS